MDIDHPIDQQVQLLSGSPELPSQAPSSGNSTAACSFTPEPTLKLFGDDLSHHQPLRYAYQSVEDFELSFQQPSASHSSWSRFWSTAEQVIVSKWLVEIFACGGSMLSFCAIVAFLRHYDGFSQPDWPYKVTLNSVVSWFATIMKSLIILVVAACLSQTTWLRFRIKPHLFNDFLVYDSASRGAIGSLRLLWDSRGRQVVVCTVFSLTLKTNLGSVHRHIASIGAVIILVSIAVNPTVQQTITIRSDQRNSSDPVSLGRAQSFLEFEPVNSGIGLHSSYTYMPTSEMIGAIYSGIFFGVQDSNAYTSSLDMNPICPTGNCTYPVFQSLAVCSSCEDVSRALTWKSFEHELPTEPVEKHPGITTYQFSLPNGLSMNSSKISQSSGGTIATSGYLPQVDLGTVYPNAILNYSQMKGPEGRQPPSHDDPAKSVSAAQCVLYWCVNTYASQVSNGHFSEEIKESWYSNKSELFDGYIDSFEIEDVTARFDIIPPKSIKNNDSETGPNFTVAMLATHSIWQFLGPKLTLSNSLAYNEYGVPEADQTLNTSSYALDLIRVFRGSNSDSLFTNLAKSMTRHVRNVNFSSQTQFKYLNFGPVQGVDILNGTASYAYAYVSVQWSWLAFPATLILLTTIFLILTIINTTRHDVAVWKSSPVPLLLHELDSEHVEHLRTADGIVKMERLASEIKVRLKNDSRGHCYLSQDR